MGDRLLRGTAAGRVAGTAGLRCRLRGEPSFGRAWLGSGRGRDRAEVPRWSPHRAVAGRPALLPLGLLPRTGRSGEDLLFGRTEDDAFFASTIDGRAKRAWKARDKRECELAETEDRERVLLRPITLCECRHTFASLLIDSGANPKAIQQSMGHSKIQTTFDVYGHLLPGSHDEVRKRMDAYLRGDRHVGEGG